MTDTPTADLRRGRSESAVFDTVKEVVSRDLCVKLETLGRNTSFIEDIGADSLDIVELVMEVEKEFDITIADERSEKFTTVGQLADEVWSLLGEPARNHEPRQPPTPPPPPRIISTSERQARQLETRWHLTFSGDVTTEAGLQDAIATQLLPHVARRLAADLNIPLNRVRVEIDPEVK